MNTKPLSRTDAFLAGLRADGMMCCRPMCAVASGRGVRELPRARDPGR